MVAKVFEEQRSRQAYHGNRPSLLKAYEAAATVHPITVSRERTVNYNDGGQTRALDGAYHGLP